MVSLFTARALKYFSIYHLIFVGLVIILSSVGAFFHFLLDHEISILESWLHFNKWEIIIISKTLSVAFIYKWFQIRLYEISTLSEYLKYLLKTPDNKTIVLTFFVAASYLVFQKFEFHIQSLEYWPYHFISYLGALLFFGFDFFLIRYVQFVSGKSTLSSSESIQLKILFLFIVSISYFITIPDYYKMFPHVLFCFSFLLLVIGKDLTNIANVLIVIIFFIAPMSSLFGFDPIWGSDYSFFKKNFDLSPSFLVVIWVVSFIYYKYREVLIFYSQKFIR
jgi:hypothetical protein